MPTLQDVAEYAGVSTATVSKVLSNTPYFSEATRQKVMVAVEALGYRPNLAARALSSGKTNIIAVVFPFIHDTIFKDPLVMRVLEGIEAVCTEHDYNILLSTPRLDDNQPQAHYLQLLQSGYLQGLIAIDNVEAVSLASYAEKINIPTVVLGHHPADYTVRSNNYLGGKVLMQHILAKGHRHIGVISVPLASNMAVRERLLGMQDVYSHADMPDEMPMIDSDFSTRGGAQAAHELIAQHPRLTVIIGMNDRMAIGAIAALNQAGYTVPDEISVVGYDDIPMALATQPTLTTINQKPVELGRAAADLLLRRLDNQIQPTNVVIDPHYIERESLVIRR